MNYVIDYKATPAEGEAPARVEIIKFKGYPGTDYPSAGEGVGRVVLASVEDVHSMGADLLDAAWTFKAKRGATKPAEASEMAEELWTMLNPKKPEKKSGQKELQSSTDDGTSSSVAGASSGGKTKEKKMAKAKKKAAKKVAKKSNGAKRTPTGPRGEKTLAVKKLLERKSGCTRADILETTGWPAVSVQAMAKAAGLKLRKEKEKGKPTVYFGS